MTMKEIAKLASTSISSVSRVINSSGYVKQEVKDRIQKILDETGYRPNAFARALHSNKSLTIGVILPKINATSSGENISGIDDFFSGKGYKILLGNTNHDVNKEIDFFNVFKEKQVDGIILIATVITPQHQNTIDKLHIPLVIMGQEALDDTPCVLFDEATAAQELTEHLIQKSLRNIAFIGVDEADIAVGIKRKTGYLAALTKHDIEPNSALIGVGDFSARSGYLACKNIFEQSRISGTSLAAPDAVFAATDKMAIGAIHYLLEQGLRIPEDVSVCGVGGGFSSEYFNPTITTLYYDFKASGEKAAEVLYQLIEKKNVDTLMNHKFYVEHRIVTRASTRA